MSSCNVVRCRVRDLASCFYACRLPFDEEPNKSHPQSPQTSNAKKSSTTNSKENVVEELSSSCEGGRRVSEDQGPRFSEDDYIVFRFREDGEIDMISNRSNSSSRSLRDDDDDDDDDEHENIISSTTLRPIINNREKETINSSPVDSFESCESNLSDSSTDSFAFPELGPDWIGSPVRMPKSEKPESRSMCLLCCTF